MRLPLITVPLPGEAWAGYLTRASGRLHTTPKVLADHIGLRVSATWPPFHGVVMAPVRNWLSISKALGLTVEQVRGMHLEALDGICLDLSGLATTPTAGYARTVSRRSWVRFAGSRYCPACLAETGCWSLWWRHPLATACTAHRIVLCDVCPECGQTPFGGRNATRPPRVGSLGDPRCCPEPTRTKSERAVCGAALTLAPQTRAGDSQLQVESSLRALLQTGAGPVLGEVWPALEVTQAWQTAACWARAFGTLQPGDDDWAPARPWISPPGRAHTTAAALVVAADLVTASNAQAGGVVLGRWTATMCPRPVPATFTDAAPERPSLSSAVTALLHQTGRVHSLIGRRVETLGREPLPVLGWDIDDVPQVAWECTVPQRLLVLGRPSDLMVLVVASLIMARAARAGTWVEAGSALGFPAGRGAQWSRYVLGLLDRSARISLVEAALGTAQLLPRQPRRAAWTQRPETVLLRGHMLPAQRARCTHLAEDSPWCPCLPTSGQGAHPNTSSRSSAVHHSETRDWDPANRWEIRDGMKRSNRPARQQVEATDTHIARPNRASGLGCVIEGPHG